MVRSAMKCIAPLLLTSIEASELSLALDDIHQDELQAKATRARMADMEKALIATSENCLSKNASHFFSQEIDVFHRLKDSPNEVGPSSISLSDIREARDAVDEIRRLLHDIAIGDATLLKEGCNA